MTRRHGFTGSVLAIAAIVLTTMFVSASPASAKDKCHAHTFSSLGPKYAANAKGKVRALWCVNSKGKIYNVRLRGSAEVTHLGSIQGYEIVSKLGPAKNKAGDSVPKNPRTKAVYFYFGYKIRACAPALPLCGPKTSYHWKLGIGNKGGHYQAYKGSY